MARYAASFLGGYSTIKSGSFLSSYSTVGAGCRASRVTSPER
jgi:hypothetical protein